MAWWLSSKNTFKTHTSNFHVWWRWSRYILNIIYSYFRVMSCSKLFSWSISWLGVQTKNGRRTARRLKQAQSFVNMIYGPLTVLQLVSMYILYHLRFAQLPEACARLCQCCNLLWDLHENSWANVQWLSSFPPLKQKCDFPNISNGLQQWLSNGVLSQGVPHISVSHGMAPQRRRCTWPAFTFCWASLALPFGPSAAQGGGDILVSWKWHK